jgi:hypothetical protein
VVRMGAMVSVDRRDDSGGAAVAPPSAGIASTAASAPASVRQNSQLLAKAVDPNLPAELPRPGDQWRYRYTDAFSGVEQIFVHEVLAAKPGEIQERMYLASQSGFSDEQVFSFYETRAIPRPLHNNVTRVEFAPYLQAFKREQSLSGDAVAMPVDAGQPWSASARTVGPELVVVPGGSFDAIKVEVNGHRGRSTSISSRLEALRVQHVIWYSPKVKRYVKYQISSWDFAGSLMQKDTIELVDFALR